MHVNTVSLWSCSEQLHHNCEKGEKEDPIAASQEAWKKKKEEECRIGVPGILSRPYFVFESR
jgi:hypothetical protein